MMANMKGGEIMSRKGQKYYSENKYQPGVAAALKDLDDNIHYKLYMLWANEPNCTLEDISQAIHRSKTTVANYISETKHRKPPASIRILLSKFFDIPPYYLMENDIEYRSDPKNCPCPEQFKGLPVQAIELFYLMPETDKKVYQVLQARTNERLQCYDQLLLQSGLTSEFVLSLTPAARLKLAQGIKTVCEEIRTTSANNEALMEYKANMQE